MNSLDTEFHRRLRKSLDEVMAEKSGAITSGLLEYPDYKRSCGYLDALKEVTDICARIEEAMTQGK